MLKYSSAFFIELAFTTRTILLYCTLVLLYLYWPAGKQVQHL